MSEGAASRSSELLVVTWNLKEAFEAEDLRDKRDMQAAARRLAHKVPRPPDVLLLTEVIGRSAHDVAKLLSALTKTTYAVVAAAPLETHIVKSQPPYQTTRDTAVVINTETMKKVGQARWLSCGFTAEDTHPAADHITTHQEPCVLLEHKPSQKRVVAVSAHFVQDQGIKDASTERAYKARWLRQIASEIDKAFPPGPKRAACVIAGDLNIDRAIKQPERLKSKENEFWKVITNEEGYVDAVYDRNSQNDDALRAQYRRGSRTAKKRIDYIFVKGQVKAASHDLDYDPPEGSPAWATDHRLVWAVVELAGDGKKGADSGQGP